MKYNRTQWIFVFILFLSLFFLWNSKVYAQSSQVKLDNSNESKMMQMIEYAVNEYMIHPVKAEIKNRYVSEYKGIKAIVIKCQRNDSYSDEEIRNKLEEFTKAKGSFGPNSGFGANTKIVRPWQKRNDIKGIYADTILQLYDSTMLNILLGRKVLSFIIFPKFQE